MTDIIYLAGPYSHDDPAVKEARFHAINKAAGRLILEGHVVYSAISHSHPISIDCDLQTDWEFWRDYDFKFMRFCSALFVLKLNSWRESKGIKEEIAIANSLNLPITYITPG